MAPNFPRLAMKKNLEVTVSKDLKPNKLCSDAVKTAYKLVVFIGRTFEYKYEKIIPTLLNAIVFSHLEYCIPCQRSLFLC